MVSYSPFVSVLAWYFLPSICSQLALHVVYIVLPELKPVQTNPPSPHVYKRARRHSQNAHASVIVIYFLYSIISSFISIKANPNYFELLGLPVHYAVDESTLKAQWRRLARLYHPDKIGLSPETQHRFVTMRTAFETLSDENKREAYLKFGPELISACPAPKCLDPRDFIIRGIQMSTGFYLTVLSSLLLLNFARRSEIGSYWRYISLFVLFSIESSLILSPTPLSEFPSIIFPKSLATFEQVSMLHSFFVSFSCLITQLGPILFSKSKTPSPNSSQVDAALYPIINQMQRITMAIDVETKDMMRHEFQPLVQSLPEPSQSKSQSKSEPDLESVTNNQSATLTDLKAKMLNTFVELRVKSTPEGAREWENAVRKGRREKHEIKKEKEKEKEEYVKEDKHQQTEVNITSSIPAFENLVDNSKVDTKELKGKNHDNDIGLGLADGQNSARSFDINDVPIDEPPRLKRKDSRILQTPSPSPSPPSSPRIEDNSALVL